MFGKIKHQYLSLIAVLCFSLLLWASLSPAAYAQTSVTVESITEQSATAESISIQSGTTGSISIQNAAAQLSSGVTTTEIESISNAIFRSPGVSSRAAFGRLKVLSTVVAPDKKDTLTQPASGQRITQAVVFNYNQGNTSRFLVNASNGQVLREETLPGRPQSSRGERQKAIGIIQSNPELGNLLQAGNVVEGGFAVDIPRAGAAQNRHLQFQILSPDRKQLRQVVYVDLTNNRIVSTSATSFQ